MLRFMLTRMFAKPLSYNCVSMAMMWRMRSTEVLIMRVGMMKTI
jgi:hypothetical protein